MGRPSGKPNSGPVGASANRRKQRPEPRLALGELEALASARQPVLLSLLFACISGQEARFLQDRSQCRIVLQEGPGDSQTRGAGLALQALLRDALGEAAEARYTIRGPWTDPRVEPVEKLAKEENADDNLDISMKTGQEAVPESATEADETGQQSKGEKTND